MSSVVQKWREIERTNQYIPQSDEATLRRIREEDVPGDGGVSSIAQTIAFGVFALVGSIAAATYFPGMGMGFVAQVVSQAEMTKWERYITCLDGTSFKKHGREIFVAECRKFEHNLLV